MHQPLPLWVLAAATAACAADGQGDFDRLENRTDATVVLVGPEAWANGDDRWVTDCDAKALSADVTDGALVIGGAGADITAACEVHVRTGLIDQVWCNSDGPLRYLGEVTDLHELIVTGNGEVDLNVVVTDHLDVAALGNGTLSVNSLLADQMTLDLGGNGDVTLGGVVRDARFDISGNGDLDARALLLQDLFITMTGSGTAVVTVEGTIDGAVGGNGQLDVFGAPTGEVDTQGSAVVTLHD
jgi:hypothetical protein